MPGSKRSSGTRKHGRNKDKCAKYKAAQKREKSRVAKIRKHLELYPDDAQARDALRAWEGRLK